jgi:hypothetical protein
MDIIVTKGDIELKFNEKDFIECKQTSDGISFSLKNGLEYYLTDINMTVITKERIIQSLNKFKNAKRIEINLLNYKSPIVVLYD